jgi:hypothetical protein
MKLAVASFPHEPQANHFTTNMFKKLFVCSYIFTIPVETDVKYAMFVAAYDEVLNKPEYIHDFFTRLVSDYTDNQKLTFKDLANELPDIYRKIRQTYIRTKVDGKVTIEISTNAEPKIIEKNEEDDITEVINDIWVYDSEDFDEPEEENGEEVEVDIE